MTLQVQQAKPFHWPQFALLDAMQSMMASAQPAQIVIRLGSQMRRHPFIPIGSVQRQPIRLGHWLVSARNPSKALIAHKCSTSAGAKSMIGAGGRALAKRTAGFSRRILRTRQSACGPCRLAAPRQRTDSSRSQRPSWAAPNVGLRHLRSDTIAKRADGRRLASRFEPVAAEIDRPRLVRNVTVRR